jgi:hypothetical protein
MVLSERGLIRGMVLSERGLIRGMVLSERGLIKRDGHSPIFNYILARTS